MEKKLVSNSDSEVVLFLDIDKYANLLRNIENSNNKKEKTNYSAYKDMLILSIQDLERFGIDSSDSDQVYSWFVKWENYISNLSIEEYRFLIDSRITNTNLDKFKVEKNNSRNSLSRYNEMVKSKRTWLKEFLNKNCTIEESKQMKKIKVM